MQLLLGVKKPTKTCRIGERYIEERRRSRKRGRRRRGRWRLINLQWWKHPFHRSSFSLLMHALKLSTLCYANTFLCLTRSTWSSKSFLPKTHYELLFFPTHQHWCWKKSSVELLEKNGNLSHPSIFTFHTYFSVSRVSPPLWHCLPISGTVTALLFDFLQWNLNPMYLSSQELNSIRLYHHKGGL